MPPIKEQNFLYYFSYYQLKSMVKDNFNVLMIGDDFINLKNEIGQLYKITQRRNLRTGGLNGPRNT